MTVNNVKTTTTGARTIAMIVMLLAGGTADAASFGTCVGHFNGVVAYSNGSNTNVSNSYYTINGYKTGMKWQCAEYCSRYYLTIHGRQIRSLGNARDWFNNAASVGLKKYPNGSPTKPRVGDILCTNSGYGHVAIIREVRSNAIVVIHQNWSNNTTDNAKTLSMTVANGKYTVLATGSYQWQGWLRP